MTDPVKKRVPDDPADRPTPLAFTPVPRKYRHDGWTPERQRGFIEALADTGSVRSAAHQVNMTPEGAYYLRRQPGAEEFAAAWLAALDHGMARLEDVAMERALNGTQSPVYCHGQIIGTRTVYNDRLLQFMLRNRRDHRFAAGASGKRHNWEADAQELAREAAALEERALAEMDRVRARLIGGYVTVDAADYAEFERWREGRGEGHNASPNATCRRSG